MRFKVPQFTKIEDKVIGPFTWRQFIYFGGGLGVSIGLFVYTNIFVFTFLGLPVAILAALLAFYPVNNQPFSIFLEGVVMYYFKNSQLYLWEKDTKTIYREQSEEISTTSGPKHKPQNLASLSRKLDLGTLTE